MENNYVMQFRKAVFGKKCNDICYKNGEVVVWYEGNKTKAFTEQEFLEYVNLNTSCEIGLTENMMGDDWEKISIKDGYKYKVKFKNGMMLEKSINNAIHTLSLIEFSEA